MWLQTTESTRLWVKRKPKKPNQTKPLWTLCFQTELRAPACPHPSSWALGPSNPVRIQPHPNLSAKLSQVQVLCPLNARLNARPQRLAHNFRLPTTQARGHLDAALLRPGARAPDLERAERAADPDLSRKPGRAGICHTRRARSSTCAHLASAAQGRSRACGWPRACAVGAHVRPPRPRAQGCRCCEAALMGSRCLRPCSSGMRGFSRFL